jgi:hypothetical protein
MSKQLDLFDGGNTNRRVWDYLLVDGDNIANILFDPSAEIRASDAGRKALEEALKTQRSEQLLRLQSERLARMRQNISGLAANTPTRPDGSKK